jgi:two-component system, sensor histidine kinase
MNGIRVLVVDDNEDAAETMAVLFDFIGCGNRTEYDGLTGLEAAREFWPDACVLDIHMPGMSGCDLAKHIRAELGDRVRLLALTGVTGEGYDDRIAAAGFDARFAKPAGLPPCSRSWPRSPTSGEGAGPSPAPVPRGHRR